jgi:hypothetical protein
MAEAGTQAPAGQVEPDAFVFGERRRPLARSIRASNRRRSSGVSQRSRDPSRCSRRAAQLAHFAALDLLVAAAEDAVDALQGVVEAGRQAPSASAVILCVVFRAAQLEFQLPALAAAILGHAMHFQRADFGQRRRQLHRDLGPGSGGLRAQHGGDGGQAHHVLPDPVRPGRRPGAWPCGSAGGRHQVEAHRPPQAQGEAALGQADFDAGLFAARQQADGAQRACLRGIVEQQEVAARRAAFDGRGQALARQRIGDRAARHGDVGIEVVQHAHGFAAPCRTAYRPGARPARAPRNTPPFSSSVSGTGRMAVVVDAQRLARRRACWRRKSARWRVMAGSLA